MEKSVLEVSLWSCSLFPGPLLPIPGQTNPLQLHVGADPVRGDQSLRKPMKDLPLFYKGNRKRQQEKGDGGDKKSNG